MTFDQLNSKFFDFCPTCFKAELGLFEDDELDIKLLDMLKDLQKIDQRKHNFFSVKADGSFAFKVKVGLLDGLECEKAVKGFKGLIELHTGYPIKILSVENNYGANKETMEIIFEEES